MKEAPPSAQRRPKQTRPSHTPANCYQSAVGGTMGPGLQRDSRKGAGARCQAGPRLPEAPRGPRSPSSGAPQGRRLPLFKRSRPALAPGAARGPRRVHAPPASPLGRREIGEAVRPRLLDPSLGRWEARTGIPLRT